jgi:TonB family protein
MGPAAVAEAPPPPPAPPAPPPPPSTTDPVPARDLSALPDLCAQPTFTPYERAPEVTNVEEARQALVREYPPALRDAGVEGTVVMWFCIAETGDVANVLVNEEHYSGSLELDAAALRVAPVFEFTPAINQSRPVAVWISIPMTFQTDR